LKHVYDMKILLLAPHPFFQNRGTPIAVRLLSEVLSREGHRIHLLTYHEGEDVFIPHMVIHRIPSIPGINGIRPGFSYKKLLCDIFMFIKAIKLTEIYQFDLIHAVEESVFMALLLRYIKKIPYVYDMDSWLSQQLTSAIRPIKRLKSMLSKFEEAAFSNSNGIIAVCRTLENIANQFAPTKPLLRLEDISMLADSTEEGENIRKNIDNNRPVIMYIGNLEYYQGIDLLIKSFSILIEKKSEAVLIIIGGSDKDIKYYASLAAKFGVISHIRFMGRKPLTQLASYLEQADILVSPRILGDNTPMKIYSFLDSGKPLLATRLTTHTQILDDNIAFLVSPEPKDMAAGFEHLIDNPDFASQLALRAKERAANEFSFKAYKKKLINFYNVIESGLSINA
jgi:glycosyltransferase involved in cell wall biosynthesis